LETKNGVVMNCAIYSCGIRLSEEVFYLYLIATLFAELEAIADFGNSNVTLRLLSPNPFI
jgi:hypothetical protein